MLLNTETQSCREQIDSLTILAESKLNHLIGWLRRPMIQAFQSDGVAIGLGCITKTVKEPTDLTLRLCVQLKKSKRFNFSEIK